jgi:hypothetical protein
MELEPATLVSRPPEVVFERLEGQVLLLSLDTGRYGTLNGTGAQLWELLESPKRVEDLIEHLVATRTVDADRAGADVRAFLAELLERGLVAAT